MSVFTAHRPAPAMRGGGGRATRGPFSLRGPSSFRRPIQNSRRPHHALLSPPTTPSPPSQNILGLTLVALLMAYHYLAADA
jgi:hypothetical protein